MPAPRPAAALVAGAALALGGCGSKSDEDRVKGTVKSFLAAAADGDGRKACGLTDAAGRRRLEKAAGGRVGCERVIAVFAQRLPANVKTGLRSVEVGRVRIEGDRATVTDLRQSKGGTLPSGTPIVLAKHGGDWKVSGD